MNQVRDRSTARRLTAPLAVLLAILLLGSCSDAPTEKEIAMADDGVDPSIVSIFTTEELLPVIQTLGTLFLVNHPGTTFQYTAKPADVLQQRIDDGVRPALWIDRSEVLERVTKDGLATGPVQPVGDDTMQFVVYEEYDGPMPTLEDFGATASPVRTGLCDVAAPCGRGAQQVLEEAGVTPQPDEVYATGKEVVGNLAKSTINTSLIYRSDAAALFTKFTYLTLPDPTIGLITYQSVSLGEHPVAQEFQSWLATSDDANAVLRKRGLRARADKAS